MDADVIIVGAGPTGLMLAGELRLGGARVIVTERLTEPTGQSRGLGFTARAMETLDQRGLLPRFGPLETSPLGHFGGVRFDYTVLPGAHFGARGVPQSTTEAVLEDWATELGADIRRGWEFTDLREQDDSVEIGVRAPDGEHRLRASYLVGCDGGHSTVRVAAGFDFPGTPATRRMFLADVVGQNLRPRPLGERLPRGMVMAAPLRPGVDRIIVCEHGTEPVEREADFAEVAAAWERITGEDIAAADTEWVSSFTDATRQVTEYRRGRILLAGDAAHIHLPAGGQGMSTGLLDAVNLGWKLAGVVAGWAPADLLDTYHNERHPAGARLLMNTRAQGMVFLGGEEAQPLRELFAELIEHDAVKRHLAGIVSGLDIRYAIGPGHRSRHAAAGGATTTGLPPVAQGASPGHRLPPVAAGGARTSDLPPVAQGGLPDVRSEVGDHPLVGRRVPPVAVGDTTTTDLLHPAQGVLLDMAGDAALRDVAAGWKDRVLTATVPLVEDAAVLVRPDGYVAWVGTDPRGLSAALHRWFGNPQGKATVQ